MIDTKFSMARVRAVAAFSFVAFVLGGCSTQPATLASGPNAEVTFDGLYEIENSVAAKAWAKPDLDLTPYSKIMVEGAGVEYRPGGETSRTTMSRSSLGPFELTEKQKAGFEELVKETLLDELGKSERFTLVQEPGPDVLLIRGALLDVVSYVPPEPMGRNEIYLNTIGEVTLVLEIRDSTTESILARAIDRSVVGDEFGMTRSNQVRNAAEVRRVIRSWTSTLRKNLDSFSGFNNPSN